jgi:uncharacterized protein (TIGR02246 family)
MMKLFAAFLITAFFAPVFSPASNSSKAESEIEQFFVTLTKSLNQKNPQAVADLFKEDGELISLAGGIYKGRKEISDLFEESFAGPFQKATYLHFVQYIRFTDANHVVVDGVWKVTDSESTKNSCGLFIYNLAKQNGVWEIALSYSSQPRQGHTSEQGRTISWVELCKE